MPPYLDLLITKLLALLQNGQKLVQEGALTAMASVADCSKDNFIKYYGQVLFLSFSSRLSVGFISFVKSCDRFDVDTTLSEITYCKGHVCRSCRC